MSNVGRDLQRMRDMDIIKEKIDKTGNVVKKDGAIVYEKHPLLKHLSESFSRKSLTLLSSKTPFNKKDSVRTAGFPTLPSPSDILQIAKEGETQIYEFKAPGTTADKIAKEIAGYVHTKTVVLFLWNSRRWFNNRF